VPLCKRHDDEVVGATEVLVDAAVEVPDRGAGDDIGSVTDHEVDGVEAAQVAGLGAGLVVGEGHRDGDAPLDQFGGGDDLFGTDQVEGALLVVLTPAPPVAVALDEGADGLDGG
jgi:hypothetical protein